MNAETKKTEPRLRFRINMLLAERDMTLKQLYDKVRALGSTLSSSHFYRQMKPYASPIRLELLALVARALKAEPSELFEFVEAEVDEDANQLEATEGAAPRKKPSDEQGESERAKAARVSAKKKRAHAMLGAKITVVPPSKPK